MKYRTCVSRLAMLAALAVFHIPLFAACSDGSESATNYASARLKPEALLASAQFSQDVQVSSEGPKKKTLRFSKSAHPKLYAAMQPGKVFVGQPAWTESGFLETNPDGFLVEILEVSLDGDTATVKAKDSTLDAAFDELQLGFETRDTWSTESQSANPQGGGGGAAPQVTKGTAPGFAEAALDKGISSTLTPSQAPEGDGAGHMPGSDSEKNDKQAPKLSNLIDVSKDLSGGAHIWQVKDVSLIDKSGSDGRISVMLDEAHADLKPKINFSLDVSPPKLDEVIAFATSGSGTLPVEIELGLGLTGEAELGAQISIKAFDVTAKGIESGKDNDFDVDLGKSSPALAGVANLGGLTAAIKNKTEYHAECRLLFKANDGDKGDAEMKSNIMVKGPIAEAGIKYNTQKGIDVTGGFGDLSNWQSTLSAKGKGKIAVDAQCQLVAKVNLSLFGLASGGVNFSSYLRAYSDAKGVLNESHETGNTDSDAGVDSGSRLSSNSKGDSGADSESSSEPSSGSVCAIVQAGARASANAKLSLGIMPKQSLNKEMFKIEKQYKFNSDSEENTCKAPSTWKDLRTLAEGALDDMAKGDVECETGKVACAQGCCPSKVVHVYANASRAYAIKEDGSVWHWGKNEVETPHDKDGKAIPAYQGESFDKLKCTDKGLEGFLCVAKPPSIAPYLGDSNVTSMALGMYHRCVIYSDKRVGCFGSNDKKQLGQENGTFNPKPGLVPNLVNVNAISVGNEFSVAISDGTLYTWGNGSASPKPLRQDIKFKAIASGGSHSCAISESDELYCWGANGDGQLGLKDKTDRATPEKLDGVNKVMSVSLGEAFSCAVDSSGKAYCWGANGDGQLGVGPHTSAASGEQLNPKQHEQDYSPRPFPIQVPLTEVTAVYAGSYHVCAKQKEILSDGKNGGVFCWGRNHTGQVIPDTRECAFGDTSTDKKDFPTPVVKLGESKPVEVKSVEVAEVAAGDNETCYLNKEGEVICWGSNFKGQVGRVGKDLDVTCHPYFKVPFN